MTTLRLISIILLLLSSCLNLAGQLSENQILILKHEAGFRDQLLEIDSVLVDSVIAYSNEYSSDTIVSFLNRTYGLPENADGYAYGFSGEIRGLLFTELLKRGLHMSVLLDNLSIKELYPPSEQDEYADYILDYPAISILVRDSAANFPVLREYVISNRPIFPKFKKQEEKFKLAYKRFLYLLLNSFSTKQRESLPEKYFTCLNAMAPSSKEYHSIRNRLSFPKY